MNSIRIIPMELRHCAAMAQLEAQCFSLPWSLRLCEDELRSPLGCYYAAEQCGDVAADDSTRCTAHAQAILAGYAGMQVIGDEGYITNIAVAPPFRQQGLGRALLERLIAQAHQQNLQFMTLEARESNLPALSLYRSLGFRQEGVRKGYYEKPKEDALVMTLRWEKA